MGSIRTLVEGLADPKLGLVGIVREVISKRKKFADVTGFSDLEICVDTKGEKNLLQLSAENFARAALVKGFKTTEDYDTRYVMLVAMLVKGLEIPNVKKKKEDSSLRFHAYSSAHQVSLRIDEFKSFFELTDKETSMLLELLERAREIHRILVNNYELKKRCYLSPHYQLLLCLQHFDVKSGWFDETRNYEKTPLLRGNLSVKEDRSKFIREEHDKNLWKIILPWIQDELETLNPDKTLWGWVTGRGRTLFMTGKLSETPKEEEIRKWVQGLFEEKND